MVGVVVVLEQLYERVVHGVIAIHLAAWDEASEELLRGCSTNCREDGPLLLYSIHVVSDKVMLQPLNVCRPVVGPAG